MDEEAATPDSVINNIHPNQLAWQQSRLLTDMLSELRTMRKWITFFGVLTVLALIPSVIVFMELVVSASQ